ncbi:hypothetical protein VHEMI03079 [[Torrubiella] hemipterigena]|uniref:Zn(2)-C6 fungal-type domain-containing protein n=1 Tax=[Torrubiella] hemipterigena TaxID=1531966 RepID=A0A0A1T9T8_9HYPO|nr:hypothetical protein VHEMI03079 [[Torrubiella] hemipterigena]
MQATRSNAAKSPREADSSPAQQGRTRSRIACQTCNRRKVKCDVSQTGAPCSNCRGDGAAACITVPRKKHRPRRQRNAANRISHGSQSTSQPSTGQPVDQDSLVLLEHADTTSVPDLEDNTNSYMGDGRGPRLSVYHLCHPQSPDKPSPAHTKTVSTHKPHELEYLRLSGAFTLLPEDLYADLIRTYFHHVHFSLPIIDAARFLTEFHSNGTRNISPLLLWSMLLAAANFTEPHVLNRAGFTTRKALKTAMYERAKVGLQAPLLLFF